MSRTLLIAAHGTRSAAGSATTGHVVDAVTAARPSTPVRVCFLDVASPTLADALADLAGDDVVVVPLLLSAGYHVRVDIPSVVAAHPRVRVARHLGPDPLVIDAMAERLEAAGGDGPVLLAAIGSSQSSAREEVGTAAEALAGRIGAPVSVLPLGPSLPSLASPVRVAVYLLAEGGFLDLVRAAVPSPGAVADPIGVHPALVRLVWSRYDEAARAVG